MERTMKYSADVPASFMKSLLALSDEMKLRVIRLLTDSLLKSKKDVTDEEDYTRKMPEKNAEETLEDKINNFPISDKVKSLSGRLKVGGNAIDWDKEKEEYYLSLFL